MGISTYAANVPANTQALHCDCMFPINSYLHDMMHQAALIAPRPLLFGEGRKDALFPVPGYTEVHEKVGSLYRGYGHPDEFQLVEVDTAHQDSDFLRETVIHWFDRYLMDVPRRTLDMSYTNAPNAQLTVFGGTPPADARNGRVWEYFTTRSPSGPYASLGAWNRRREELVRTLRERVFRALVAAPRNVRLDAPNAPRKAGRFQEMELSSDDTVPVRTLVRGTGKAAVLYIASDTEDPAYIGSLFGGLQVPGSYTQMAVFPRGVGEAPWDRTFWKATLRNAMQVGETVDSMRLADVLAAVEALAHRGASPVTVVGKGVSGVLGLYAAILNPAIAHVVLIDPPVTHAEGPIFLSVLRYTDLPEAAALIAPRRLTFYARQPAAYAYSRHVWRLYGRPEGLATAVQVKWTAP